ncbi:vacuolar protein sorting 55-domain-containing protein [Durotheca rogersii]|uniref:vacuolar protein sorting 55-domain-containing protein n=1 Tax=Durotheca rogersii TaxID=419775 RepID=UPI00221F9FBD|nr:vacuolar protein sorting 55-domain-containing protein [Durotheca rogersii]KAI5865556.1 vacuolar protein sorting 55-domain-containing protein [Durotheca rogersii]
MRRTADDLPSTLETTLSPNDRQRPALDHPRPDREFHLWQINSIRNPEHASDTSTFATEPATGPGRLCDPRRRRASAKRLRYDPRPFLPPSPPPPAESSLCPTCPWPSGRSALEHQVAAAAAAAANQDDKPKPSNPENDKEINKTPATMATAGLKTIIALSFVLAVGFLLVILSCALYGEYYPLLVVGTYVLAPVPNWVAGRCANPDDFESAGTGVLDLGRFCTGFLVVMGIALPAVLAHSGLICVAAMAMSIIGGLLIYGTVISFGMFFQEEQEF